MIFVTVGTQVPFPRMMQAVSAWAVRHPDVEIVAQVGKGGGHYAGMRCHELLRKDEFDELLERATLLVSHAGMGSILSALTAGIPILVMPRKAALGEHRNEHQIATARAMHGKAGLTVAWEIEDLVASLSKGAWADGSISRLSPHAPAGFVAALRNLIESDSR